MPTERTAGTRSMAELRTVIYLRGTDSGQLDDAEQRCGAYAQRFGWQIMGSVRDGNDDGELKRLLRNVRELGIEIIMTGNLDMISPEPSVRDELMAAIERRQCIVQPVGIAV